MMLSSALRFSPLPLLQTRDAVGALPESVVRDHVKARLLHALDIPIGKDSKGFGSLTRMNEPLSETAATFVTHLRRFAAVDEGKKSGRTSKHDAA